MPDAVHYRPEAFPPREIEWTRLIPLIGRAHAALARYDGVVAASPNARRLLSSLAVQEAVLSSRIEGTTVTMTEVLEIEAGDDSKNVAQHKRHDAEEVLNCRDALTVCARSLDVRPISLHLLREAHARLMKGVRGRTRSPGAFRRKQNWIGPPDCPVEKATFIPAPPEHLSAVLDRWADYAGSRNQPDPLVQLALVHAGFEAIHPFEDGNGRLGRMIVPLFLYERKILGGPDFYMSGYLEAGRDRYIEALLAVSRDGAWTDWCAFFLQGLIDQASDNQSKAERILELYRQMQRDLPSLTRSPHAARAIEFIFSMPIFSSRIFLHRTGIPRPSASRILRLLGDRNICRTLRKGRSRTPAIHAFSKLLNIVEGRNAF